MLMGCNVEEDNNPPPEVPDTREPIEDPQCATEPDNIDEDNEKINDDEDDVVPDLKIQLKTIKMYDPDNINDL
ncbi:hypothetical protein [Peribacillus sp. NPDC096540]|uniref:hypothetical protein n=1 Tax=Peribacillus sp. NPDC096540 TaxID=3390612 RepID=UPI003CFE759C